MAQVVWTDLAVGDLKGVHEFIAKDSEFYAEKTIARMIQRVEGLVRFPEMGRVVPEFNVRTIRELREGNYRIVYRYSGDQVEVLAVWHSARRMFPRKRIE